MSDYYLFALSLVLIFSLPGPDMILLLQTSSTAGKRAGFMTVLGLGTAKLCHVILTAMGLGTLFRVVPLSFEIVKYAGAAYLFWLGVKMLRPAGFFHTPDVQKEMRTDRGVHYFIKGLLTNLLNPKALLFTSILLPQFIFPEKGSVPFQFFLLGLALLGVGFVFDTAYALGGVLYGRFLLKKRRVQRIQQFSISLLLIGFGVRLLLMSHV
jgi:threonine/homoserine/homoserine lactone efflux protein